MNPQREQYSNTDPTKKKFMTPYGHNNNNVNNSDPFDLERCKF